MSRLEFGDSTAYADLVDPGYEIRLEEEGVVSVVAAMADAVGGDEADSVSQYRNQQNRCSDVESASAVGDEPQSVAFMNSRQ
jgi:hypothetical protein